MKVGDWVRVKSNGLEYIVREVTEEEVWFFDSEDSIIKVPKSSVTVVETFFTDNHKISPHYTANADGKDFLQRFFENSTPEEVKGAMVFTMGKYIERLGKKDAVEKELDKIIDYAARYRDFLTK